jgi:hypothetical protein
LGRNAERKNANRISYVKIVKTMELRGARCSAEQANDWGQADEIAPIVADLAMTDAGTDPGMLVMHA